MERASENLRRISSGQRARWMPIILSVFYRSLFSESL